MRRRAWRPVRARPLLEPGRERRWAWVLLGAGVIVVFAIGAAFAHQTTADGFDRAVDDPVINWLGQDQALLDWMQFPGTQVPAAVLSLALAIAALARRQLNGVVLALLADFIATRIVEWLLKPLFDRTYLGAISYPSGHTTSVVTILAVYVVLFVLPARGGRAGAWRLAGVTILLALVIIAIIGVIGLRWHYFTDTVGGAAVAVGTVCAMCLLIDACSRWRRRAD